MLSTMNLVVFEKYVLSILTCKLAGDNTGSETTLAFTCAV